MDEKEEKTTIRFPVNEIQSFSVLVQRLLTYHFEKPLSIVT